MLERANTSHGIDCCYKPTSGVPDDDGDMYVDHDHVNIHGDCSDGN